MTKSDLVLKTLFLGLEAFVGENTGKTAFLRAAYAPELSVWPDSRHWLIEQGFAPLANTLRETGYNVLPDIALPSQELDTACVLATRSAEENTGLIARAWDALKEDGWLVIAQHNDFGAKRLEKLINQIGEAVSVTKHHCRAVACRKTGDAVPDAWRKSASPMPVADIPLKTVPGIFSWRQPDAGSVMLADTLSSLSFAGQGADIAAGWGYLSWRLLEEHPAIASLHLYEAEKRALDRAAENLRGRAVSCHWCDAARPLPDVPQGGFDWAVMNPPAHDMTQHAPDITWALFQQAAAALKPGASLWLVAGRQLPYETHLKSLFKNVRNVQENSRYKILEAAK